MNRKPNLAVGFRPHGVNEPNPPPTPQEIAQRCAAIQAEWDDETRIARMTPRLRPMPWTVPGAPAPEQGNDD